MIKKISFVTLFVLFAAVLVYGAINRTAASSQKTTSAADHGSSAASIESRAGQGLSGQGSEFQGQQRQGQGRVDQAASSGQGRGQGQGANRQGQGSLAQNVPQAAAVEQITVNGTVVQAPQQGVDMILQTDDGELLVGTGPGYLAEQGFLIQEGESLEIDGFWEYGEFKPTTITRLTDGESILLRDEWGRPMWSGALRNGRGGQGGI